MPRNNSYVNFILEEQNRIKDFIEKISIEMYDYISSKSQSRFVLFYKYLTHSDLATFGKATKVDSHEKNLLYYMKKEEMVNVENKTNKPFQTAHQSCIGLMKELYNKVGLPQPRENDPYLINDFMNVYVVNKNMEYFTSKYTKEIFNKLNKQIDTRSERNWIFDELDFVTNNEKFTPIELHVAVHGLGMSTDIDFHKIRHHLFKGDTFILLFEIESNDTVAKNMYMLFEKNPIFFSIIGESNKAYEAYQKNIRKKLVNEALGRGYAVDVTDLEEEVTRQQQSTWRKMLAKEMMGYTQEENQVFCPFTYITTNNETLGTLFRASHIKAFSDPKTTDEEKYDINNGLLLCANADALFDKHFISVDENKELIFSFLLDDNIRLKQQLLLLQPIFQPILNDTRMKYLEYHRNIFIQKEEQRRKDN